MNISGKILIATIGTAILFGALAAHAQDGCRSATSGRRAAR